MVVAWVHMPEIVCKGIFCLLIFFGARSGKRMYSFDSRIRYSEVDSQGNITLNSILDYFQDCTSFHSEDLNRGMAYLKEREVAWVLVSWQVEVQRYAKCYEYVNVGTWPTDFKGILGKRNFALKDKEDNMLACADTTWTLIDTKTGRPIRIPQEIAEAYQLEEPLPMECESRKIKIPESMKEYPSFEVQKFHLDTNQHVNNGKYILMALEYLPQDFKIRKMRAEYKKSAIYGNKIFPWVSLENEKAVVALCDAQKKPYAVIEF